MSWTQRYGVDSVAETRNIPCHANDGHFVQSAKIICPWHGACFNACTGDIEDAPGLDGLHTYTAEVKDGQIFVTANMKTVLSKQGRSPIARAKAKKSDKAGVQKSQSDLAAPDHDTKGEKVVIVGGGSAGLHTIEALREHNFEGSITLLSKEDYAPIDRTKLSKALLTDVSKLEWRSESTLKSDYQVDMRLGTEVTKIDPQQKMVETNKGDKVSYDKLVLAPGSVTKRLPIDGADLEGVHTLRGLSDAQGIVAGISEESRVVIIGTSFIGLELAGCIAGKKPKSVDVIGMDPVPFEKILGADIGKAIQKSMEKQGIKFHMEAGVEKILPSEKDSHQVGAVAIKGQAPIPADLLIMGVGVAPATQFLEASGFSLEKDKGITVDEYLRIKGHNDIFAIGDIAHYPQHASQETRRIEHWNVAGNHGRSVAESIITPSNLKSYDKVPIFWSSAGGGLRYVSRANGFDDVYIDGDLSQDELKFAAYYAQGDEIVAVATIKRDPYMSKAALLMGSGQMPSFSEVKNGKDILEVEITDAKKSVL